MLVKGIMITENEVIQRVCVKLKELKYEIVSTCTTIEKGTDIVAKKENRELLIEAKGGTSSIKREKIGKPFDRNQAKTHISVAIFKILQLREKHKDALLGIALPYEKNHYELVQSIKSGLEDLKITIFWCNEREVKIENNNLD